MSESPSARALLLTILGDVVLPTGGQAWLQALSEAAGTLDVSPSATRQALRRLASQGLVEPERHGRLAAYRLTPAGRQRLEEAADRIYLRRSLQWDGHWRMLTYSFSEDDRTARDALRREIEWLGYGSLGAGTWVCPWDLGSRLESVLNKHGVAGDVDVFVAELAGDDTTIAARAYDLDALRAHHDAFVDRFSPQLDRAEGLDASASFALRIELVHEWRKFLFADPGLPDELLPADWRGDRAADVFLRLYRSLEGPSWAWWEGVAAGADPIGEIPDRPRSNLDRTRPSVLPEQAGDDPFAKAPAASGSSIPADDAGPSSTGQSSAGTRTGGDGSAGNGTGDTGRNDDARTEEFLAHLHDGGKVEAGEWMPEQYRQANLKFIEMHANSELMGALPEREWIARAPTLRRKRSLAAKVQDEVGHAHLIYRVAETLGKPREQMFADLIAARTKFHNVFHYPTYTWGDVACIGFLVDGAAIVTQRALLETSYLPYVRVMRRVVAEESLHYRHGEDIMLALASGTDEQFEMLQEAVDRWWEPTMHFFGTDLPREKDPSIHWGVKTRTNEESRQEWLTQYVPKLWDMGVEPPDPGLRWNAEAERWDYTEPDWDKLMAIVKGEGTDATKQRRWWRQQMHDNHAWIREIVTGDQPIPVGADTVGST